MPTNNILKIGLSTAGHAGTWGSDTSNAWGKDVRPTPQLADLDEPRIPRLLSVGVSNDESGSWYGCLIRVETGGGIMTIDTVAQQVLEPFGGAYTEYEDGTGLQDYCAYLESLD